MSQVGVIKKKCCSLRSQRSFVHHSQNNGIARYCDGQFKYTYQVKYTLASFPQKNQSVLLRQKAAQKQMPVMILFTPQAYLQATVQSGMGPFSSPNPTHQISVPTCEMSGPEKPDRTQPNRTHQRRLCQHPNFVVICIGLIKTNSEIKLIIIIVYIHKIFHCILFFTDHRIL